MTPRNPRTPLTAGLGGRSVFQSIDTRPGQSMKISTENPFSSIPKEVPLHGGGINFSEGIELSRFWGV